MRVKSEIWVKGYLQKLSALLVPAFVTQRGHESAGAIYLKINLLNGFAKIYSPAPSSYDKSNKQDYDDRCWIDYSEDKLLSETEADQWLREQASFDSDLWIVEVEDKSGNCHLEDCNLFTPE